VFNIVDYKQTDFYWGINRPEGDAFYNSPKNLKKPPHRRSRPWPSVKEFWESTEPKEFKLYCQDQADFRKFRVWLRKQIADSKGSAKTYDQVAAEKFASEVDISVGDNYDLKGIVNTNIAVFNWDYTYFMSPEDLKKLKGDKAPPAKLVPPKSFDLATAERVVITKEELKQRELQEQEKLKEI
jgi:hypothetical protein